MTVTIAFDNAQDFARRRALLGFGIYEITNGVEIVGQCRKRDFGSGGAAVYSGGFFPSGHGSSKEPLF